MVLHAMNDDRLGPYRLLRRLGEGGMGVVHLAVDPQGRQVAVKVLRSEVAGDELARRRLSREVETMRRVRSRYIAEVVDADVTGHRPYIVTRYVPGRSLDEIVKEDGPLGLPALLKVAHGVAAALAAVHSVGVIHRDLKPGNVLIIDGEPVLIDFGIAQAVDATRLTQTGMFIGTPGYLAPEIIEGQEAGPEVDIHAWAGTLLYAATGQPPFGKGTLEMVFYNITAGKADVDAAPAPLQPLLKAAFQRNPAKRPKAAELAERVARLMPQAGVSVPDEVSTVPHTDPSATPAYEGPTAPGHDRGGPRPVPPVPQGSGPQAAFPQRASAGPQGPVVPPPQGPAQSLLGGAAAGAGAPAQGSGPQASGPQVPGPQASGPPAPGPQGPAAQGGARGGAAGSGEQQPDARPSWEMSTPPVTPRKLVEGQDHPVPPPAPEQQYVSLRRAGCPPRSCVRCSATPRPARSGSSRRGRRPATTCRRPTCPPGGCGPPPRTCRPGGSGPTPPTTAGAPRCRRPRTCRPRTSLRRTSRRRRRSRRRT
jgi:serine/threonine protein kinase